MSTALADDIRTYNELKARALAEFGKGKLEKALDFCRAAAGFASHVHIGLWYDSELEEMLSRIGARSGAPAGPPQPPPAGKRKVAYIASFVSDMGGHSRSITEMVRLLQDGENAHRVFVTNPAGGPAASARFREGLKTLHADLRELDAGESFLKRIAALRSELEAGGYGLLILFVTGDDVVACSALSGMRQRPFTLFYNHNDIDYWLGRNVTDCLVDLREEGARYSRKFRRMENIFVLPLTSGFSRQAPDRAALGVPEGSTLSLSLGSFYKVLGDPDLDCLGVIGNLLRKYPNHHHIFLTGPPPADIQARVEAMGLPKDAERRLRVYGPEPRPLPVYSSADFLIETYPMTGGMVRVEAMATGLPIVAFHNKKHSLISDGEPLPPDYPFIATSNREAEELSGRFIQDRALREEAGRGLREHFERRLAPGVMIPRLKDFLVKCLAGESAPRYDPAPPDPSYDVEYANRWRYRDFHPYRSLFIRSLAKESAFTFRDRRELFSQARRRREFERASKTAAYLMLLLAGRRGARILGLDR